MLSDQNKSSFTHLETYY